MNWGALGGALKVILPFVPGIGSIATTVIGTISASVVAVETVTADAGFTGASKKKLALALVSALLTVGEDVAGKDVVQDERVLSLAGTIMDLEVLARNTGSKIASAHVQLEAVIADIREKAK